MTDPDSTRALTPVRVTIWIYFWLLLGEGMLRKWVLPEYSDLLFIIRDPVVVVAYLFALRAGIFPFRPAIVAVALMTAASLALSLYNEVPLIVTLFGVRTDFLHLPFIFIIPRAMDRNDVALLGKWLLITSIPIFLLMVVQFNSDPTSWVNSGVGAGVNGQIRGAMGKIRAPGPFSFITGVVLYYSLVSAFVVDGVTHPGAYARPLLLLASVATLLAIPISISRSLLMGILIVAAFSGAAMLRESRRLPRLVGASIGAACLLGAIANTIYVQAFVTRWDEAVEAGGGGFRGNVLERVTGAFTEPFSTAANAPLLGRGIGLGTVAGARMMTGQSSFLLSESELSRDLLELGPVLGFAFIAWRGWLVLHLLRGSWKVLGKRGDPLPWLITGAIALNVLSGQWGPATHLGFAVFGAGIALAAMKDSSEEEQQDPGATMEAKIP